MIFDDFTKNCPKKDKIQSLEYIPALDSPLVSVVFGSFL